jgi:hypothetical protein
MGRLRPEEQRFLAEILLGFITRDYLRTAEVHFEAGHVPAHHSVESFVQALRAIGEPIHNGTAEDISMAKLLTLLFEVTGLFDMRTRPEALMLQKIMVVVERMARTLDPRLDIGRLPSRFCGNGSRTTLVPLGSSKALPEMRPQLLVRIPKLLQRALPVAEQIDVAAYRKERVAHVGDRGLGGGGSASALGDDCVISDRGTLGVGGFVNGLEARPRAIGAPASAWPRGIDAHCELCETGNFGASFGGTQIGGIETEHLT